MTNSHEIPRTTQNAEKATTAPATPTPEEAALSGGERYIRQTIFPGIGREGQEKLARARVLIVGCGALGSVLANNLGRAGVGFLRLVDRDFVEANNLQRQILYDERDVLQRMPKATAAAERLRAVNRQLTLDPRVSDLTAENVEELVADVDIVLDGTDNFETRYLLNDACVKLGKPWIYTGVVAAHGVTLTILPGDTACLRCVFPDRPLPGTAPTCDTAGILNGIVGVMAGIAATEAIKYLIGSPALARGILWVDLWENTYDRIELPRMEDCPACGQHDYSFLDAALDEGGTTLCGRNAVQVRPPRGAPGEPTPSIDLQALADRLAAVGEVASNGYLVRFRQDGYDFSIFPDGRAIIKGTDDFTTARTLYARYIGM